MVRPGEWAEAQLAGCRERWSDRYEMTCIGKQRDRRDL